MPKAIKKRTKKKTLGTETEIKDRFSDLKERMQEKQKNVLMYGLSSLGIVLVIVAILFFNYSAKNKARELESKAYAAYYNLYAAKAVSRQQQFQNALDLFQQSYEKKKSPRVLLYIANAYYELGKYDDALKSLEEFTGRYKNAKDLLPLAYQKMAYIQIKKGSPDEALKHFSSIQNLPGGYFKDLALIESARILETRGKKEEAAAKYKELSEKFPESPFAAEAKSKLGEGKEKQGQD